MKAIFKNTTKYDKENCNNFVSFHINKYAKRKKIKYILAIIVFLYMIIFNLVYKNWYIVIILILAVILLYYIDKIKKVKNKKQTKKTRQYSFYFYKNYIKIKYRKEFQRILYFQIKKIFETEENFFLYTDDTHSLILDKKGFEIGNPIEFSEFIKKKCPFKYSNENK